MERGERTPSAERSPARASVVIPRGDDPDILALISSLMPAGDEATTPAVKRETPTTVARCVKCSAKMRFDRAQDPMAACLRWDSTHGCACTRGDDECGCEWPLRPSTYTSKTPTPVIPREERVTFTSINKPVANGPYTEQRGNIQTRKLPPNGRVMLCRAPCAEHVHDTGGADGTWVVRLEPAWRLREAADAECILGDTAFTDEEQARGAFEAASEWLRGMEAPPEPDTREMIEKSLRSADALGDLGVLARKVLGMRR